MFVNVVDTDNRFLLKPLSKAAADTILSCARKKGALPAIFTAFHSFGRDLKWIVHIHLSATCGGITQGSFSVENHSLPLQSDYAYVALLYHYFATRSL